MLELLFIIGAIVFGIAVFVGGNIWAMRDPPGNDLIGRLIDEIETVVEDHSEDGNCQS